MAGEVGYSWVQNKATFTIQANSNRGTHHVEDNIDLGADGGLYAELVKNRSFEFDTPLMGWKVHSNKDVMYGF